MDDYGWAEVERDLRRGLHPETVAARLGENINYLLEVATNQGWPIIWDNKPKSPFGVRTLN